MPIKTGSRIGAYEIVALIGAGGMGEVYRARDAALGRDVAIKVLPALFSHDEERLRRFVQEAQAAAALNHPNILAIHQVGQHEGAPFIVSELLDGESLRDRLAEGALPARKALDYAVQTARGLAAAHDKGIVHRDLKPDNLFVTTDGRVKILDFGIAKLTPAREAQDADRETIAVQTDAGSVLGTPGYMAPEQVRGQAVDARADIFSLGAILYEMLSGRRAFKKETAADTMSAVLREDPPELTTADRHLPPVVERIVKRCLEKNPHERFQSARDLAFALEDLSSVSTSHAAAADAPRSRSRAPIAAAATVGVVLLAGLATGWWRVYSTPVASQPTYQRLTFRRGALLRARFAPDAKTVVYGAAWDGADPQTFVVTGDSPESRPLGVPKSDIYAISSTGELAISLRDEFPFPPVGGTLARAPLVGGAAPREVMKKVEYADFAPDGALAVTLDTGVGDRLEYPVGTPLYETPGAIHLIRVSPDGGSVAFQEVVKGDAVISIVGKDKQKRVVSDGCLEIDGLAWTRDGAEIWFAARAKDAGWGLFAVTPAGRQRLLLRMPGQGRLEDVTRDGRLLLSRETRQTGIRYRAAGAAQEEDLSWLDRSRLDDVSMDGRAILFSEIGEAGGVDGAVYLRKTDGSPAVRLGSGSGVALSPDGHWALTMARSGLELNVLPTGAGTATKLRGQFARYWGGGAWLSDGKRVVFPAMETKHDPRLYVQEISGDPKPISPEGLVAGAAVSPDGRIATVVNGKGLLLSVSGGEPKPIAGLTGDDAPVGWTADGRALYVARGDLTAEISLVDVASGARTPWKTLVPSDRAGIASVNSIYISPDGASYAYSYTRVLSELYLVDGVK
jgi:Tol biopolymer transport system component